MAAGKEKPLEWAPRARDAYFESISRIAGEDTRTASLVIERVDRALALISRYPGLGTPASRRGERRFAVPTTGHVVNYRVTRRGIRIVLWYRARQNIRR